MPPSAALLNHLFPHTADVFHILLRIFGREEYIRSEETNTSTPETTHVAGTPRSGSEGMTMKTSLEVRRGHRGLAVALIALAVPLVALFGFAAPNGSGLVQGLAWDPNAAKFV